MKLYAICLVKNEDDVIGQTLNFATRFCDKIFVIDNGSTDNTWEIVKSLGEKDPKIIPFVQTHERYDDGLRWLAYDAHHDELTDSDWWLVLDSDEFMAEDPRPVIEHAMRDGADIIVAWQIQFYYTEKDYEDWKAGRDNRDLPIFSRRRYYRIDYQEPRLFRNQSTDNWETAPLSRKLGMPLGLRATTPEGVKEGCVPTRAGKISRRRILNRHYQYRDPLQMEKRLKLRFGHPAFAAQVDSVDWRLKMRPSKSLKYHKDGQPWRFSLSGLAYHYPRWLRYVILSRLRRAQRWLATLVSM